MLNDFRFKKSLGQNFISDVNFLNAIVSDSGAGKDDDVLEIGPGAGALTEALANVCRKVLAVEKDGELKPLLDKRFERCKNVEFLYGDFLKFSKKELEERLSRPYKVVANLPYYITTPIIFKLVEEGFAASSLTIMVQKEVAERLVAKPGTKDYGIITVKLSLIADIKIARAAPRALFFPVPNVDSAVVNIVFKDKKDVPVVDMKFFNRVVNAAFGQRRKMLASNLAREFGITREKTDLLLKECEIDENVRGEVLTPLQFVKVCQKLT